MFLTATNKNRTITALHCSKSPVNTMCVSLTVPLSLPLSILGFAVLYFKTQLTPANQNHRQWNTTVQKVLCVRGQDVITVKMVNLSLETGQNSSLGRKTWEKKEVWRGVWHFYTSM